MWLSASADQIPLLLFPLSTLGEQSQSHSEWFKTVSDV